MRLETTPAAIRHAAELIRRGELVAFPTETVYGLGADATNERAVSSIFAAKGRPSHNPLIVHIASADQIHRVARQPSSDTEAIVLDVVSRRFWPGPITMVLPKTDSLPAAVSAGLPTIGVRVPAHPVAKLLLEEAGVPIAAPSANPSNYISATTAAHVERMLGEKVSCILDGGPCEVGVESTIIRVTGDDVRILRSGGVTAEQLEDALRTSGFRGTVFPPADLADRVVAPGMSRIHYAPRTPLVILDGHASLPATGGRIAVLSLLPESALANAKFPFTPADIRCLSPRGDLTEAANRLFSELHELDLGGFDLIVVLPCPADGLGAAIMDRLRRAGARTSPGHESLEVIGSDRYCPTDECRAPGRDEEHSSINSERRD